MSESFFFACIPRYLRVQHSFAKGIKPNTTYRIAVYKGIQKSDEMKQAIKSKIVGGKIDLQSPQLFFNIPFYNPTKNIHFNLKLFETKPNQDQTQIGSYVIMSSDYIKSYKTQSKSYYQIEGMLKDDLFFVFDLFVEKSKFALTDAIKKQPLSASKVSRQIPDDNSQSSRSRQMVRSGEGFLSPSKRIQRKNGRIGKLRSRNSSRSDGQQSQQGSMIGDRKIIRKSPMTERQGKFTESVSRLSPRKNTERQKSIPKSDISENKIETQSQAIGNQNNYKYQPKLNQKYPDNNQLFDLRIQNKPQRQSIGQRSQVAKSALISAASPRQIKSNNSQSSIKQPVSKLNATQLLSPRSPTEISVADNSVIQSTPRSLAQPSKNIKQQPSTTSVTKPKMSRTPFELDNSTEKVFDIVNKKQQSKIKIQTNVEEGKELKQNSVNQSKLSKKTSNAQKQEQKEQKTKSKVPRDDVSEKTGKQIEVKGKQILKEKGSAAYRQSRPVSIRQNQSKKSEQPSSAQSAKKSEQLKNTIIYVIFLVVSAFLIYNAMMPTRRA